MTVTRYVIFLWIPKHIDFVGNEALHSAAKQAGNSEDFDIVLPKPLADKVKRFYTIILGYCQEVEIIIMDT